MSLIKLKRHSWLVVQCSLLVVLLLCAACATQPATSHRPTPTATVILTPTPVVLKGTITEFAAPERYPNAIAPNRDGEIWFSVYAPGFIWHISSNGTFNRVALPGLFVNSITSGSDGAMWCAGVEFSGEGEIGAVGLTSLREFPIDSGSKTRVSNITAGPDGALWFIESGHVGTSDWAKIGRITTTGKLTEYALPSASFPRFITAGPDGAIWFTDDYSGPGKIGRITTDGRIAEYPLPSATNLPLGIVSGPDGALWFTEWGDSRSSVLDKIGRIATDGHITEFPLHRHNSAPAEITVGPDGALWFTEAGAYSTRKSNAPSWIGRITTQGVITDFPLPSGGSIPSGIAASSTAIWFTEYSGQRIGQLS